MSSMIYGKLCDINMREIKKTCSKRSWQKTGRGPGIWYCELQAEKK